jgi:hypothetical protein
MLNHEQTLESFGLFNLASGLGHSLASPTMHLFKVELRLSELNQQEYWPTSTENTAHVAVRETKMPTLMSCEARRMPSYRQEIGGVSTLAARFVPRKVSSKVSRPREMSEVQHITSERDIHTQVCVP